MLLCTQCPCLFLYQPPKCFDYPLTIIVLVFFISLLVIVNSINTQLADLIRKEPLFNHSNLPHYYLSRMTKFLRI